MIAKIYDVPVAEQLVTALHTFEFKCSLTLNELGVGEVCSPFYETNRALMICILIESFQEYPFDLSIFIAWVSTSFLGKQLTAQKENKFFLVS